MTCCILFDMTPSVAGSNSQLCLVRHGNLKVTFLPVLNWLETHANPALGVRVNLAWFQATTLGYCQLGLVVYVVEGEPMTLELAGSPIIKIEQHSLWVVIYLFILNNLCFFLAKVYLIIMFCSIHQRAGHT